MATTEHDVKLIGKGTNGETAVHFPITRLGNIQPTAAVKESPAAADFLPLIDSAAAGQMKKTLLSAVKGKRTARFVVGTTAAGWTQADCDYLCDGDADEAEINAAVQALPATGGEIILLDGTYHLADSIIIEKDGVTLTGNGSATILKRMFAGTSVAVSLLYISSSYNTIQKLRIDGNKASFVGYGIYLNTASHTTITDCFITNCSKNCIQVKGASYNIIQQNTFEDNASNGIYGTGATYNIIKDNFFVTMENNCIYLFTASNSNSIVGNYFISGKIGISLTSSDKNRISGNIGIDNTIGIAISTTNHTVIIGNTFLRGSGLPEDYDSTQATIKLQNTSNNYCLIAYNNIPGKDCSGAGGTGNTIADNKFE